MKANLGPLSKGANVCKVCNTGKIRFQGTKELLLEDLGHLWAQDTASIWMRRRISCLGVAQNWVIPYPQEHFHGR